MFAADSPAQRAFEIASSLSPTADPKWTAAIDQLESAGLMPSDDPTAKFPLNIVQDWLGPAGHPVEFDKAAEVALILDNAYSEMVVRYSLRIDFEQLYSDRRSKDGANASLERSLEDIATAARTIMTALYHIRGELLNRRLYGERHDGLESLHYDLHNRFLYGQWRRLDALIGPVGGKSVARLISFGEVGSRAGLAPTWLEEALEQLAQVSQETECPSLSRLPGTSKYSLSSLKCYFVTQLAKAWGTGTGRIPTVSGRSDQLLIDGPLSGFQIFHQQVCGHMAALLIRTRPFPWTEWQQEHVKIALKALGLRPPLSPRALGRCLERMKPQ